jgi:dihydroneopterin aldolase
LADQVLISGIRFHGFHGLTRLEREIGVRYSVDVELTADLARAAATDRLSDTIDYRKAHEMVVSLGRAEPHHLIETFAERLCGELLDAFPASAVTVTVRKETPLLDGIVDHVGVRLSRAREP